MPNTSRPHTVVLAPEVPTALLDAIRTHFIVSITDAQGIIVEANDAFCAISQFSREELIGASHRLINSRHHPREFFETMWRQISRGESWRGDICNRAKDGSLYWVDSVITPFKGGDGQITHFLSIRSDITQRKTQEEALRKSEQLLHRTGALASVGGWELEVASRRLTWSPQTFAIHGMPHDVAPTLEEALALYPTASRARIRVAIDKALNTGEGWDIELPFNHPDGRLQWLRMVGAAEIESGRLVRLHGAIQDVTALREMSARMAQEHELLRVTLRSIGDAVITTDAQGRIAWLNPVAERMTGWVTAEAQGLPLERVFYIVHEQTRQPAPNPVADCLRRGEVVSLASQTVLISRSGMAYGIEDSAAPIRNEHGHVLGAVLVFHDVTEQRRLSGEMRYRAMHDTLTGLLNRAEFETRLGRLLQRVQEHHSEHALLYIDLDQFKLVNDACGHMVGDQLLQQVAKLLTDTVRTRDTLARLGGDEFAVILEHCTVEQAQRVAHQICERMEDFRFTHDERRFRIGTSIGLVPLDHRWQSTTAVMQAADTACYAAKEAGRHRVHAWFDTDQAMRLRQGEMQWATRLEQALDEDGFVLYAQAITPIRQGTGDGLHLEVLLRLMDKSAGVVLPGAFLPAAERFHLSGRVDRWVLRQAIAQLSQQDHLRDIDMVCINLSGQSVGDRAFHQRAIDMLTAAGPEVCHCLCLEITETAAITNLVEAASFIAQLHALGVRIALDDFGAGASSFGYLKSLSVDLIKIDGQFIKDLIDDPLDDAAVRCFVDVARVVGVKTVAEFVDKPEVLQRVGDIGIDFAQGFLLHRPQPLEQVLRERALEACSS